MSQVSKYPVSEEVYERIFEIFLKTLEKLGTKRESANFLGEFLTPTEQVMLAKRLAIAFLLVKNYSYREISKILRVSTGTVSRVAVSMKGGEYFKKVVGKVMKDEEIEKFILNVGEKVAKLLAKPSSKSGTWRYIKEEMRTRKRNKVF